MKFGRAIPYSIVIEPTANMGFAVHVGCCHVSFEDWGIMLDALKEYLNNPKGVEAEYNRVCGPQVVGGSREALDRDAGRTVAQTPGPTGSGGIVR